MAFADVLGHTEAKALLARALEQGRLPPALLLSGPEGIGKRTLALAVGRALLCQGSPRGCGVCRACRSVDSAIASLGEARERAAASKDAAAFNHRLHPDFVLVEPVTTTREGGSKARPEIRVDQVREVVKESFGRPFEARFRFFLIDDAHLMNPASANSLLKSLEEPPASTHFALCSAAPQALLPTILSRCQRLMLKPLPLATLETHLEKAVGLSPPEARLRAVLADGSLGRALAFEAGAYRRLREQALATLEAERGALARLEQAQLLADAEDELPALLLALRALLRDVAALGAGVPVPELLNPDLADRLLALARTRLGATAGSLAERVAETLLAVQGNAQKQLELDVLLDAPELRGA